MANFRRNVAILSEAYHSESDGDEDCTFRKSLNRDDEVEGGSSFSEDDRFNEDLSPEFAVEDIQNLAVSKPGQSQSRQSSTPLQDKGIKLFAKRKRTSSDDEGQLKAKRSGKGGPKALLTDNLLNDLVDIISNDERHRRKLIFTNSRTASNAEVYEKVIKEMVKRCQERSEPFQFNVTQTRNKFKKLMSTCKTALMTQKNSQWHQKISRSKGAGSLVRYSFAFNENKGVLPTRASIGTKLW